MAIAFLTTKQAAIDLGISHRTLEKWRACGAGPSYFKLGRAVRYASEEVEAFAQKCRRLQPIVVPGGSAAGGAR